MRRRSQGIVLHIGFQCRVQRGGKHIAARATALSPRKSPDCRFGAAWRHSSHAPAIAAVDPNRDELGTAGQRPFASPP
jgi:hypothetical protein